MKFLIMIQSNAASSAKLAEFTQAQRLEFGRAHRNLSEELAVSGELIVSEGLADQSMAKRVSVRDGATVTTDGPFAEVKEQLAGFYLVECDSYERAVEHAAKVPDAQFGHVEVRPVLDLRGLEM
ncbi:MAG: YciI family protein [Actinomycetota bacterium]|nr:YciI family protein [Actinomycetota bacterium]